MGTLYPVIDISINFIPATLSWYSGTAFYTLPFLPSIRRKKTICYVITPIRCNLLVAKFCQHDPAHYELDGNVSVACTLCEFQVRLHIVGYWLHLGAGGEVEGSLHYRGKFNSYKTMWGVSQTYIPNIIAHGQIYYKKINKTASKFWNSHLRDGQLQFLGVSSCWTANMPPHFCSYLSNIRDVRSTTTDIALLVLL